MQTAHDSRFLHKEEFEQLGENMKVIELCLTIVLKNHKEIEH